MMSTKWYQETFNEYGNIEENNMSISEWLSELAVSKDILRINEIIIQDNIIILVETAERKG